MAAIQLRNLQKRYDSVDIMRDVNIDINDGEFVALVGPSGCGKSTLLRLISGLEDATSGDILFDGQVVNHLSPAEREIAMVFQSYALYPHMTVRKNLSFGLENLHIKRSVIEQRIADAAKMLGLESYMDRKPKALSGGQRQRVAIGRAIVRNPKVFLFDEPLSNLDAKLRVQTRGEISKLHKKLNTTMIYVTHDQIEAMTMAEKIVVVNAGHVEQVGKPLDLFERPANRFVAEFIGSPKMNIVHARIQSVSEQGVDVHSDTIGSFQVPVEPGEEAIGASITLGIRPSHIQITETGVPLSITQLECMGHETFIYGHIEGEPEEIILHVPHHFESQTGKVIHVQFSPEHMHVFSPKTKKAFKRIAQ